MGQLKKMIEKKHESRVKTPKGQSRTKTKIFSKTHRQSQQKNEKSTTRKNLKPLRSLIPFGTRELEPSTYECFFQTPKSITMGIDACQITIFRN